MTNPAQPQSKAVVSKPDSKALKPNRYHFEYRTVITPRKKVKFLKALTKSANVTVAADSVAISRTWLYAERDKDHEFAQAWDAAMNIGVDRLEYAAHKRAFDGSDKPLVYKGEIQYETDPKTGIKTPVTIKEYSDTLTIFLLKAHRPEKYRDQTNVNVSGTITMEALVSASMQPEPVTIEQAPEPEE